MAARLGLLVASALAQGSPLFPVYPPVSEYFTGLAPASFAVGDFNGDGRTDFVSANQGSFDAALLLGLPGGGFVYATSVALPGTPEGIAAGDLNLDGFLDAAVACAGLQVLLGDGAGQLLPAPAVFYSFIPASIALGDTGNDGLPEAILTPSMGNFLAIVPNLGAGAFGAPVSVTVLGAPRAVAAADFNLDGALDLAAACSAGGGGVKLLLNAGSGQFPVATPLAVFAADSIRAGDLDGDAAPDLVATSYPFSLVALLRNLGTGSFSTISFGLGAGLGARACALGDFNGDGKGDVALSLYDAGAIRVYFGTGTGSTGWSVSRATTAAPRGVELADFTGDGRSDLLVGNSNLSTAAILAANPQESFPTKLNPRGLAAGDWNADGQLDAATADAGSGTVSVLFGAASSFSPPSGAACIDAADVDRDGRADLAIGGPGGLAVVRGDGLGGFGAPSFFAAAAGNVRAVVTADLDADGFVDLVAADGVSVVTSRGNGLGGFAPPAFHATALGSACAVAVADFDLDGKLDVAAADFAGGVSLLLGLGLSAPALTPTPAASPFSLAAGDLNADGKPDLAVAELFAVVLLYGTGGGVFALGPSLVTPGQNVLPPGPPTVVLGDLNGDGRLDIAASHTDAAAIGAGIFGVSVFLADNFGGYAAPLLFAEGCSAQSLTVADRDADGRADLLFVEPFVHDLVVLKNQLAMPSGLLAYGAGTPGCLSTLGIAADSTPKIGNATFHFAGTNAPANALGVAIVADAQDVAGSDLFGLGAILHVNLPASTQILAMDFRSDPSGIGLASAPIPNVAALAGMVFFAEAVWLEPVVSCAKFPYGLVSSRGLRITLLP